MAVTVSGVGQVTPDASGQDLIDALNAVPAAVHLVRDGQGTVYGVLVTSDVKRALTTGQSKRDVPLA